ncbi:hypothetical protein [Burkholderia lata]|uniref:Uncharacterized protein n=1 Tax=Burkholderia lata (strain ATCC 17760 / DSM 23089 / LMG 22485 / NCIMB 9086 / R18194 / 383) TaxID=482957 RepID=A0A6P2GT71_BURL3|nr:hypothetical protein [Burkholderia lata]VWB07618.1 hypothetical protein BLA6863_00177 [Burkholderia lata]
MNTADYVVAVSNLTHQINEASAMGFFQNPNAVALVSELATLIEKLEELALAECVGRKV